MSQMHSAGDRPKDIRDIGSIVWRRKWVLLLPMLAGLLAGVVIAHPKVLKPVYRSSSTLLLDFPQPVTRELQGILPPSAMQEQLARLNSLMQSNEFLLKVADATGLRDDKGLRRWVAKSQRKYPDLAIQELQDLRLTQVLRNSIRLGRGKTGENVVVITASDNVPDRARAIVQALTTGVIEANRSAQIDRVRSLHDFSQEQLVIYKQRLAESEKRLEEYESGSSPMVVTAGLVHQANVGEAQRLRGEASADVDRLSRLRSDALSRLESTSAEAATRVRQVLGGDWTPQIREIRRLEREYAEATLASPSGTGSETAALVIARTIEEAERDAGSYARDRLQLAGDQEQAAVALLVADARLSGAESRLTAYDALLDGYRGASTGLPQREATLKRLKEDVEANQTLYNAFVSQLAAAQISEAFQTTAAAGRLTILEPASRPLSPVKPNRTAVALLGLVIGLSLGIAGMTFLERHDLTYRDAREVERTFGIRVLGTMPQIPALGRSKDRQRAWDSKTLEQFLDDSPGFQELRRFILDLRGDGPNSVGSVTVTSARDSEGKTTACILLAATAAVEEPRTPILLVDLDVRSGALGAALGMGVEAPGVLRALETGRLEESWFRKTLIPNLHVLPLGTAGDVRGELLSHERLAWLVPELRRRYGLVVFDTPPNIPVPDAFIVGQCTDAVLIVLKAGSTARHMVERSIELQKQFTGNVRGIIMNNVNEAMPYYYNRQYYNYGYPGRRRARAGSEKSS